MAKRKNDWQDTDKVLGIFGEKAGPARRAYRESMGTFINK